MRIIIAVVAFIFSIHNVQASEEVKDLIKEFVGTYEKLDCTSDRINPPANLEIKQSLVVDRDGSEIPSVVLIRKAARELDRRSFMIREQGKKTKFFRDQDDEIGCRVGMRKTRAEYGILNYQERAMYFHLCALPTAAVDNVKIELELTDEGVRLMEKIKKPGAKWEYDCYFAKKR